MRDRARGALPRPCRVLVLLNPRSGKGKALQQFQRLVQPLLAEAEVSFKLMVTGEYAPFPGTKGVCIPWTEPP